MSFAFILKFLEFAGGVALELDCEEGGVDGLEAGFEAERALLQRPQLLETQRHVVHRQQHYETVVRVFLEL
jgi:hypothetical protein